MGKDIETGGNIGNHSMSNYDGLVRLLVQYTHTEDSYQMKDIYDDLID